MAAVQQLSSVGYKRPALETRARWSHSSRRFDRRFSAVVHLKGLYGRPTGHFSALPHSTHASSSIPIAHALTGMSTPWKLQLFPAHFASTDKHTCKFSYCFVFRQPLLLRFKMFMYQSNGSNVDFKLQAQSFYKRLPASLRLNLPLLWVLYWYVKSNKRVCCRWGRPLPSEWDTWAHDN